MALCTPRARSCAPTFSSTVFHYSKGGMGCKQKPALTAQIHNDNLSLAFQSPASHSELTDPLLNTLFLSSNCSLVPRTPESRSSPGGQTSQEG